MEGQKNVMELLDSKYSVESLYVKKGEIFSCTDSIPIQEIDQTTLETISTLKSPQPVLAVAKMQDGAAEFALKSKISFALVDLQDPGNLGTIIRIADWFGIDQVILSKNTVEQYNPKVVQASMGSLFRVPIFRTSIDKIIAQAKTDELTCMAADVEGKSLKGAKAPAEGVVFIGNESQGIPNEVMMKMNEVISISGSGKAESLNAAVAAGVIAAWLKGAV